MNTRLANFLSIILHPLLVPTSLFSILFFVAPFYLGVGSFEVPIKLVIVAFTFIYTFALPAYFIYLLKGWGMISSLQLDRLKDRRLPYFVTTIIYAAFGVFIVAKNAILLPYSIILWQIAGIIFCSGIISLWWQISAHAAGMGGVVGVLTGIFVKFGEYGLFFPLLFCIILSGYVIAARLALNAHTPAQVSVGFVLGLGISLLSVLVLF